MASATDKTLSIRRLNSNDANFSRDLAELTAWESVADASLESTVRDILQQVRERGDQALVDFSVQFDKFPAQIIADLRVSDQQMNEALASLDSDLLQALELAVERITLFHEQQRQPSWMIEDKAGTRLGQKVTALDRVGVYVPGGKAAYPSSVLMNVLPAKIAGVKDIVMVSPAPLGELNPTVLAAAKLVGVDQFYAIGGAQAVAALAYGTQSIPRVDKIVGPGNRFVACAKRLVFGQVGLDMVAGPSEIAIVCDGKTNPDWIAMDLFSQAEHDEHAQALLICTDVDYLDAVECSMNRLLNSLERAATARQAIENRSAFIQVATLDDAIAVVNQLAPEHLELSVESPELLLESVRHAGAVFMGRYTPEAFGDYCAGPNHVLPTSSTARFASPLGVYDFQKRTSVIHCTAESAAGLSGVASVLARAETLTAHAMSAEYRGVESSDS